MNLTIKGKRILVTGAGQGIGRELAKKLTQCDATVIAISKSAEHLKTLKDEMPQIITVVKDVTSSDIEQVIQANGPYDGVVNNAAISILGPFLDIKEESFTKTFDVNVTAVFRISQIVAKIMVKHNIKGSIVNVSSKASKVACRDHVAYCGTKAAVDAMSRVMALELGQYGIRVNCVNPTVVMTSMGRSAWGDPNKAAPVLDRIPLHRFAETEDVVNAILFLLSDEASFINSVTLPVDGGFLSS